MAIDTSITMCAYCHVPLIFTFEVAGYEWQCPVCKKRTAFFDGGHEYADRSELTAEQLRYLEEDFEEEDAATRP